MIFLKENEEVCGHLKNYIDYVDSEVPVLEGRLGLFDAEENCANADTNVLQIAYLP